MTHFPEDILALAQTIVTDFTAKGRMVATAESCTGGLIAGALTEIPGSSSVVDRGFVTYTNASKMEMLGVQETALQMAHGALFRSHADLAVAVTGIAGPGGGSAEKPVGLVHLAAKARNGALIHHEMRYGDIGRDKVRLATVKTALEMLIALDR